MTYDRSSGTRVNDTNGIDGGKDLVGEELGTVSLESSRTCRKRS